MSAAQLLPAADAEIADRSAARPAAARSGVCPRQDCHPSRRSAAGEGCSPLKYDEPRPGDRRTGVQASMREVLTLAWVKRGRMAAPAARRATIPIWMYSTAAKACG